MQHSVGGFLLCAGRGSAQRTFSVKKLKIPKKLSDVRLRNLTTSTQQQHYLRFERTLNARQANYCHHRFYSRYTANTIMSSHCKEFRFGDYDIIGFDLDGTLLRYNLDEMVTLEYDLLRRFLVEKKNYPQALLDKNMDRDFLQKGLILDADRGNILKLSSDATIARAAHGTTLLTTEEIINVYGSSRKWAVTTQFLEDPLSTWNGAIAEKFRTLLDYFDLSVSLVFAQAVDVLDSQSTVASGPSPYKIWPDILEGVIEMYTRENFANGQSKYFEALRAQPDRYILRTSDDVLQWLRDLRSAGKKIFLLTGSNIDFANFTASYALGNDWQQLFDSVICFAKKPGFFSAQRPYLCVDGLAEVQGSELNVAAKLPLNTCYSQGNWAQLQAALGEQIGKESKQIRSLYVGDNLIQDVYTPVKHRDLEAIAVSEELMGASADYEYREMINSSFWGSYFYVDNNPTLWAGIIANYSQLCIPDIDSVAKIPLEKSIFCENAEGYFPEAPEAL